MRAHQRELITVQLSGPEGFGAITFHQSLLAVDLVLRLPGGEALQQEETRSGEVSVMISARVQHHRLDHKCALLHLDYNIIHLCDGLGMCLNMTVALFTK